jgi:hypothetical protein
MGLAGVPSVPAHRHNLKGQKEGHGERSADNDMGTALTAPISMTVTLDHMRLLEREQC